MNNLTFDGRTLSTSRASTRPSPSGTRSCSPIAGTRLHHGRPRTKSRGRSPGGSRNTSTASLRLTSTSDHIELFAIFWRTRGSSNSCSCRPRTTITSSSCTPRSASKTRCASGAFAKSPKSIGRGCALSSSPRVRRLRRCRRCRRVLKLPLWSRRWPYSLREISRSSSRAYGSTTVRCARTS